MVCMLARQLLLAHVMIFAKYHFSMMGLLVALASAVAVHGVPVLQLDVVGPKHYNSSTETTVADSDQFTLRALLNSSTPAGQYFISAAIIPQVSPVGVPVQPSEDFGSFSIDGSRYSFVDGNMVYGVPPLEAYLQSADPGDLSKHGIYQTYFAEIPITFNSGRTVPLYNVQDGTPGTGVAFYTDLVIDSRGLKDLYAGTEIVGFSVHFDLYSVVAGKKPTDVDVGIFAPFSHDAQGPLPPEPPEPPDQLPDGGLTLVLLGLSVLGLGAYNRRRVSS